MKFGTLSILSIAIWTSACTSVSETGRSRIRWLPENYMNEMGLAAYGEETAKFPTITSGPQYEMVQRIGQRIAAASGRSDYDWQFKLLDAPEVINAFALPGGRVAVYTGLLRIADTEDQLAAVMGHEVAHATAEHGNERVTINLIQSGLFTLGGLVAQGWGGLDEAQQSEWLGYAAAIGEYGVSLPFSREHESEADEIGLRYMVRAGYDPAAAPTLWDKMGQLGGERGPEWQSTHPDPINRAARLREITPRIVAEERENTIERTPSTGSGGDLKGFEQGR